MKDANGIELKHGDIVLVEFVRINAPTTSCYCEVINDKLSVISGVEPKNYYSRKVTKVGEKIKEPVDFSVVEEREQ